MEQASSTNFSSSSFDLERRLRSFFTVQFFQAKTLRQTIMSKDSVSDRLQMQVISTDPLFYLV